MKPAKRKGKIGSLVAILDCVGLFLFFVITAPAASEVPANFDNQGKKIFSAQRTTPEIYLKSD